MCVYVKQQMRVHTQHRWSIRRKDDTQNHRQQQNTQQM